MSKDITIQKLKRLDGPVWMYFMNSSAANKYATLLNTFIDYQDQQIKDLQYKLNTYEIEESVTIKQVDPKPKGYCIKRTPENAKALNNWANEQHGGTICKYEGSGETFEYYIYSIPVVDKMYYVKFYVNKEKIYGFTELFTAEEFFAKVGYTPEPKLIANQPIGVYEGVEIFKDTKAWFVYLKELKIVKFDHMKHSLAAALYKYSKMYLTPKGANARLRSEIAKKAMDYPITITSNEYNNGDVTLHGRAMKAIEKEYNITYLPE